MLGSGWIGSSLMGNLADNRMICAYSHILSKAAKPLQRNRGSIMSRVIDQYQRASNSLAGGVASSTRLNRAVGHPMYFDRALGCRVWDLDGKEYIDLCCSHGATLLGHGDRRIRKAVEQALDRGAACS